ncbi:MAG TPA: hypothetical protein VFZ96_02295 [Actinomycetota bacterium]|nr:hypothetical protein [Actinomycetota bacterium]
MGDDFRDLTQPGPERAAGDLARQISDALGEPPGRLAVEREDEEMAWLVRDGVRLSSFNLRAVAAADAGRRADFVKALAALVRRYEELRPTLEGLEPGKPYVVDYKHEQLRRIFRVKGTLLEVSPWQPAEGPAGGGWTLTLESKPRFGPPSRFRVQTDVLTRIVPDAKRSG